jgi:hypothetical protein
MYITKSIISKRALANFMQNIYDLRSKNDKKVLLVLANPDNDWRIKPIIYKRMFPDSGASWWDSAVDRY